MPYCQVPRHLFQCGNPLSVADTTESRNLPQGVKLTYFFASHLAPKYFKVVANSKQFLPLSLGHHCTISTYHAVKIFARATKRTLQWVIYNVKGHLNPRWHPLTTIDLRSKSCMCCILESGLTRNFAADLSLQIFKNH